MMVQLRPEGSKDPNQFYATVLQADQPTPSKRIYSRAVLATAVHRFRECYQKSSIVGQFGNAQNSLRIDLDAISHQIKHANLLDDGRLVVGITTLASDSGRALRKMLDHVDMFLVMRGTGEVSSDGMVSDLDIITFDVDLMQNLREFDYVLPPRKRPKVGLMTAEMARQEDLTRIHQSFIGDEEYRLLPLVNARIESGKTTILEYADVEVPREYIRWVTSNPNNAWAKIPEHDDAGFEALFVGEVLTLVQNRLVRSGRDIWIHGLNKNRDGHLEDRGPKKF